MAGAYAVGGRVTVVTTLEDPSQLTLHPHVVIAEVVEVDGGPAYYVEHTDTPQPHRFGPFTQERLRPGWRP